MDTLKIKATKFTPDILLDCENHYLEIKGKSYPPDIKDVYAGFFSHLRTYLDKHLPNEQPFTVNIDLIYFNSGSARMLSDFFEILEQSVNNGKNICVNWFYDMEDEDNLEYGEDFRDESDILNFNLVPKEEENE
jgi:hypothetical protein